MPLSRSNIARSKSRSPAPPVAQSSPQYFPPSHFAVAGGFVIPDKERSGSGFSEEHPSQDAYMPISYLSSASSDPSSLDYNDNHSTESRSRKSSVDSSKEKRKSQIHNLPLVEAQLLPSLRDTIDKMTRPPSRMTASSTPTIKFSRQNSSEDYSSGGGSIDISPYPPLSPSLKPPSIRTPTTPHPCENRPTTPKRSITPKTSGVLKSALKAPTPKISSTPSPTPVSVSSQGGGALRSVRSLLRRKSSSSTAPTISSVSDDQASKENQPATTFDVCRQMNQRSRSRTDPGTFIPAKKQSDIITTQSNYSTSKPHQTPHTSHIPRFRGGTFAPGSAKQFVEPHHNDAPASADESDLEYRFEVEGRDRRKLTVANAVVVPSSSSESEDDPAFHSRPSLYAYIHNQRLSGRAKSGQVQGQEGKIGLGLTFTDQNRFGERDVHLQLHDGYNHYGSDRVQIYHQDHDYEHVQVDTKSHSNPGVVQVEQSRSSIASYPSAGSIYTDDGEAELSDTTGSGSQNQSLDLNELDETHSRRKAALLGLVRGLDGLSFRSNNCNDPDRSAATGLGTETSGRSILSEEESDYYGEKGLAVSGSLGEGTHELEDGRQEESASESEYGFEAGDDSSTLSRQKFGASNNSPAPQTPRTAATPQLLGSNTSNASPRASRYSSSSDSNTNTFAESSVSTSKGLCTDSDSERLSKSSKRRSLHPSSAISPPTVPSGRHNNLPPSPRLPISTKDKSHSLRSSRILQVTTPDDKDYKAISKRKSHTKDLSPSTERFTSPYASPLSPASASNTALCTRVSPTPGSITNKESHNSYESVVLAKRSMEALVRTRQAFGIPPSESDAIYRPSAVIDKEPIVDNVSSSSTLPPTDSMASGVNVAMERSSWGQEVDNELSVGAENLFRTLSQGGENDSEARGCSHRDEERRRSRYESQQLQSEEHMIRNEKSRSRERRQSRHRSRTPVARPGSTQRTPDGSKHSSPPSSWRSMVGPDRYKSLLNSCGETEVKRQEEIWELRMAETAFVERLSSVVNLFIIPLRVHSTKTWISGVPLEIAKVLDWLEDIVNLHTQIRDTLQSFQTSDCPCAGVSEVKGRGGLGVAYALRSFVPRLEVYQPYLVKISGVLEMLERLMRDEGSDFGEFVRIQEKTLGRRVSFSNMLLEPADRVATYPDLFRKVLRVTPKNHEEYLPTLMLVHSAALVVKTLQAVKAREEEYELIKSISERIDGLPTATNLARRGRRLLCHGQLLCPDLNRQLGCSNSRRIFNVTANNSASRANRLVDAINDWDTRRSRSGSVRSNNSASTGVSFRSVETSSPPPPPQLSVLVFSDLVVLATTRNTLRENSKHIHQEQQGSERWTICDDIGIAKVLGMEEMLSNTDGPPSISVDLLPVELDLNQSSSSVRTRVKTLQFQLPLTVTSNPAKELWISAFQRSSQSTLRNLSNPDFTQTGGDIDGPNHLLEQDRQKILESILETGLPLPKSPSLQLADELMGHSVSDSTQMEREERGWWSLQFQQLLREKWHDQAL